MRRNQYAVVWMWLMTCPLTMDYKGAEDASSHLTQIMLVLPAMFSCLILFLISPRFKTRPGLRGFVTIGLLSTVAGSIVPQLVNGNDFANYLRVLLPFMLFVLGYLATCHPWDEKRIEQIERALFAAMVISLIFSFGFGMANGGGLDKVRFRIVSATFLGLQGMLLHEFVVAKRFPRSLVLLFMATVTIELLSVTRSLLVSTVLIFALATWLSAHSLRHLARAIGRALLVSILLGAMVAGSAALFPSVAKHWTQRMEAAKQTPSGKDPTTITRLAEMKNQYDQVTSSTRSLLLGEGFAHRYRYSPSYLPDLTGQISEKDFYAIVEWTAGHNFWVYQLFAGGLLFGLGLPVAILYALYRCAACYRQWRRVAPHSPYLPTMGRMMLILAGMVTSTIGGNPLGPRFSGLIYGIALGVLIACHSQLTRLHARRRPYAAAIQAASAPQAAELVS